MLVSADAQEALGAEHECEDLGAHRLKDFDDPERLFHLRTDERHASESRRRAWRSATGCVAAS